MVTWKDCDPHKEALDGVRAILRYIGEDPEREGLVETPARVVKALMEMTSGMKEDPKAHLARTFECRGSVVEELDERSPLDPDPSYYEGLVLERDIAFTSTCEHHLLPFMGRAHIAYLVRPESKVVGISKLARVTNLYARRLQMQERLTHDIATAIETHLDVLGVMVVLEATHTCMSCRGARNPTSSLTTSVCRGVFRRDAAARSEVVNLITRP